MPNPIHFRFRGLARFLAAISLLFLPAPPLTAQLPFDTGSGWLPVGAPAALDYEVPEEFRIAEVGTATDPEQNPFVFAVVMVDVDGSREPHLHFASDTGAVRISTAPVVADSRIGVLGVRDGSVVLWSEVVDGTHLLRGATVARDGASVPIDLDVEAGATTGAEFYRFPIETGAVGLVHIVENRVARPLLFDLDHAGNLRATPTRIGEEAVPPSSITAISPGRLALRLDSTTALVIDSTAGYRTATTSFRFPRTLDEGSIISDDGVIYLAVDSTIYRYDDLEAGAPSATYKVPTVRAYRQIHVVMNRESDGIVAYRLDKHNIYSNGVSAGLPTSRFVVDGDHLVVAPQVGDWLCNTHLIAAQGSSSTAIAIQRRGLDDSRLFAIGINWWLKRLNVGIDSESGSRSCLYVLDSTGFSSASSPNDLDRLFGRTTILYRTGVHHRTVTIEWTGQEGRTGASDFPTAPIEYHPSIRTISIDLLFADPRVSWMTDDSTYSATLDAVARDGRPEYRTARTTDAPLLIKEYGLEILRTIVADRTDFRGSYTWERRLTYRLGFRRLGEWRRTDIIDIEMSRWEGSRNVRIDPPEVRDFDVRGDTIRLLLRYNPRVTGGSSTTEYAIVSFDSKESSRETITRPVESSADPLYRRIIPLGGDSALLFDADNQAVGLPGFERIERFELISGRTDEWRFDPIERRLIRLFQDDGEVRLGLYDLLGRPLLSRTLDSKLWYDPSIEVRESDGAIVVWCQDQDTLRAQLFDRSLRPAAVGGEVIPVAQVKAPGQEILQTALRFAGDDAHVATIVADSTGPASLYYLNLSVPTYFDVERTDDRDDDDPPIIDDDTDDRFEEPDSIAIVAVTPNPGYRTRTLSIATDESLPVTMAILDARGVVVRRRTIAIYAGTHDYPLDLTTLDSGLYRLVVTAGNRRAETVVVHYDE